MESQTWCTLIQINYCDEHVPSEGRGGAPTMICDNIVEVPKLWNGICNWPEFRAGGSRRGRLSTECHFKVGSIVA